jgi:uncharacterized membrane protein SirB2
MEVFYLEIRHAHIGAALTSGAWLLLRALALNALGMRWPLAGPVRWLQWTIDTVLLTAALMLMTITGYDPIEDGWLTVKVGLIGVYVVLGYFALRGATARRRRLSLGAAGLVFAAIYGIARAHHPLGWLA